MDIFGNSKNPFYRFGQMMTLKKIAKEYWKPFIHDSFYNHGKSISDDMIERICNAMQCHSWYVQQFCFLIWTRTATEVTEEIYQSQLAKLLDTNADMFITDIDGKAWRYGLDELYDVGPSLFHRGRNSLEYCTCKLVVELFLGENLEGIQIAYSYVLLLLLQLFHCCFDK